jgi:hypothetical protein
MTGQETMERRRRAFGIVGLGMALVALALPGCGGSDDSGSARPEVDDEVAELTPTVPAEVADALGQIGEGGQFTLEGALEFYGLVYGALPGTDVPEVDEDFAVDGTLALLAVEAHRSELTPEQAQAFDAALNAEDATNGFGPVPDVEALAQAQQLAEVYRVLYAQRLGFDLSLPLVVVNASGRNIYGDQTVIGGRYRVRIYARARANAGDLEATIAHEVFHAFQMEAYGGMEPLSHVGAWIVEGGAEWVDAKLVGQAPSSADFWPEYLTKAELPLFRKSYDAKGFYAHLEETGHDPWAAQVAMWRTGTDNAAAFAASGATDDAFLDSWASGLSRRAEFGAAWDATGPGITTDRQGLHPLIVQNGSSDAVQAPAYTEALYSIARTADVVVIDVSGHGRVSDGTVDVVLGAGKFCTREGGCECPDGSGSGAAPPAPLGKSAVLALTGGTAGATGTVAGQSLEDHCEDPGECLVGRWYQDFGRLPPEITSGGAVQTGDVYFEFTEDGTIATGGSIHRVQGSVTVDNTVGGTAQYEITETATAARPGTILIDGVIYNEHIVTVDHEYGYQDVQDIPGVPNAQFSYSCSIAELKLIRSDAPDYPIYFTRG